MKNKTFPGWLKCTSFIAKLQTIVSLLQELRGPKDTHEAKYSVVVKLLEPIITRFVRIIPTSAPLLKIMRAELYGCIAEPMPPYNGNYYMTRSFLVLWSVNFNILDNFNFNAFFFACFMYSYHNNLLPQTFNTTLLLIAKYTHIILEMLITTDHISVEETLNSSQSSI